MTLTPIRGAPPGASSPDFPTEEPGHGQPNRAQQDVLHHPIIDRGFDLKTMANEPLADLGA